MLCRSNCSLSAEGQETREASHGCKPYISCYAVSCMSVVYYRNPIDVESYQPKLRQRQPKPWLPCLGLLELDKQALLNPVGWLSDSIINAVQCLIQKQFPHVNSMQDVCLGRTMAFQVRHNDFMQILHSNDNHWLMVSSSGLDFPQVQVLDSLYLSIPTMVKAQIASLLCMSHSMIQVDIMDIAKQVSS